MDKKKKAERYDTPESKLQAARDFRALGDENFERDKIDDAEKNYEKSYALYEELTLESGDLDVKREWALLSAKMGAMYDLTYEFKKSATYYLQNYRLKRELADALGTDQSLSELATAYADLAEAYNMSGDMDQCERCYHQCIKLRKRLAKKTGDVAMKKSIIEAADKLAFIYNHNENDLINARKYLEICLDVSEEVYQALGTPESLNDLSISAMSLGDAYNAEERYEEAKVHFRHAYELRKKLFAEKPTTEFKNRFALACQRMGDVEASLGDAVKAEAYYRESLTLYTALAEEATSVDAYHNVIFTSKRLSKVTTGEKKRDALIRYFGWAAIQKKNGHDSFGHYNDSLELIKEEFGLTDETETNAKIEEIVKRFEAIKFDPTI